MAYTVHEVAKMSGTTIKTLYHYQKTGLLAPETIGDNGYRYYGDKELARLQQILFYRELDLPLAQIKIALDSEPDRLHCLIQQRTMLRMRQQRLAAVIDTLDKTIRLEEKGARMEMTQMFSGLNKEEWGSALTAQNKHLEEQYQYRIDMQNIDPAEMNKKADEAIQFMTFMADALRNGVGAEDARVAEALKKHIAFLKECHDIDAESFAVQARFLMTDSFHRNMLESQQTGLSYFICCAAELLAVGKKQ